MKASHEPRLRSDACVRPHAGAAETLRKLNLPELAGRPAADVFLAILEFVCPPGGAVDEAIVLISAES